jgi:hypothetical protein
VAWEMPQECKERTQDLAQELVVWTWFFLTLI